MAGAPMVISRAMLRALVPLLLVIMLLPGCRSSGTTTEEVAVVEQSDSVAGEWTVIEIGGIAVAADRPPDLVIAEGGRITGFGGVNQFNTSVDAALLRNGWFAIGEIASTRMAGSPEAMDLESRYFNALRRTNRFYFDGEDLYLVRGDSVFVRLTRSPG